MFDSFFWEWNQHQRINDASRRIGDVRNDIASSERDTQRKLDQLMLINMAMWSFIEEKLGVTEQQLADRIRDIDLRDGKIDGRLAREGLECPKCKRVMSVRHQKCLYCGEAGLKTRVFS
jgi:hypothetical protein